MSKLTVRAATVDDLPMLVRHRRGMFLDMAPYPADQLDGQDRAYLPWLIERLQNGRVAGFVACLGELPVASGCVWLRERHPAPGYDGGMVPYLLSMFTEHTHRGGGAARAIVEAALEWSREQGAPVLELHASEMGRPIYERMGFERTWEMRLSLKTQP